MRETTKTQEWANHKDGTCDTVLEHNSRNSGSGGGVGGGGGRPRVPLSLIIVVALFVVVLLLFSALPTPTILTNPSRELPELVQLPALIWRRPRLAVILLFFLIVIVTLKSD